MPLSHTAMHTSTTRPVVLCFSGLDPSGGAGLQADIESIAATGAHAAVCCTALTIQSSQQVFGFETVAPALIQQQAHVVLNDLPVAAFKTGMLGSLAIIDVVHSILLEHAHLPYVFDPVMVANSGGALCDIPTIKTALQRLIPLATISTPNTIELFTLCDMQHVVENLTHLPADQYNTLKQQAIAAWFAMGAKHILVKGGHEQGEHLINTLYSHNPLASHHFEQQQTVRMPRLAAQFHGSGCSLASFIAGQLAKSTPLHIATAQAQLWLAHTLHHADTPHPNGQRIPRRTTV